MIKNNLINYNYHISNNKIITLKNNIEKFILKNNKILDEKVNISDNNVTIKDYLNTYIKNYTLNHYFYFYYTYLVNDIDFKNSIGIDYGCWIGLSTIILSLFGCNKIYSFDFFQKYIIDNIIHNIEPNANIEYNLINNFDIGNNIDWIVIYDVLCCYYSSTDISNDFKNKISYFYNILNDNGILIISDFESNSKIKINDLIKMLYLFKINLYYNDDNGRFVIKAKKINNL